ncbi:hypothetical protein H2248_002180 [Termitomyces sp. 'cryptogamus']|nr:hypothetical protein H2248_002180 [Termitomyces sp. 'cryptogamus']
MSHPTPIQVHITAITPGYGYQSITQHTHQPHLSTTFYTARSSPENQNRGQQHLNTVDSDTNPHTEAKQIKTVTHLIGTYQSHQFALHILHCSLRPRFSLPPPLTRSDGRTRCSTQLVHVPGLHVFVPAYKHDAEAMEKRGCSEEGEWVFEHV